MKNKILLLTISTIVLIISTGYFGLQYVRYKDHDMYHRSKMNEFLLLTQISKVTPVGTTLENFLNEFGLTHESYHSVDEKYGYISIKPSLDIPVKEQKDYTGFSFKFENNVLVNFNPNGPQPEEYKVDLTRAPIGKKLGK
jgi:hypothetical protein